MFKQFILMLPIVFIGLSACLKKPAQEKKCEIEDQLCDQAILEVQNKTTDTIYYNNGEMGTVTFSLTIKPNETITFNSTVGVEVHFDGDCKPRGTMVTTYITFGTSAMYYMIKMDRCTKHAYFYKTSTNNIEL